MKSVSRFRLRLGLIAAFVLGACSQGSIQFTAAQDAAIMAELETVWAEEAIGGLVLSLCEDRALSDAWNDPGNCQEAHVVRGGGRGLDHKEDSASGIGCGGCPFDVQAYVRGTLSGGTFTEPVAVEGRVVFGDLYDVGGIFDYPYILDLRCTGAAPPCNYLTGSLFEDGRLTLQVLDDWDDTDAPSITLQAGEAADCTALP